MKKQFRHQILKLCIAFRMHQLSRFFTRHRIIILMYHGFVHDGQLAPHERQAAQLEVGKFKQQLDYLKAHHNVVPIEAVIAHYRDGQSLPERPVVLTVDDGYASFYHLALPLLVAANLPAAVFLTTDFIDKKDLLWPDRLDYAVVHGHADELSLYLTGQCHRFSLRTPYERTKNLLHLKQLARQLENTARIAMIQELERQAGISLETAPTLPAHLQPMEWGEVTQAAETGIVSIGSHTASHPVLTNCSKAVMHTELLNSKITIERNLGRVCEQFCYPFGTRHDFSQVTRQLVKEAGYTSALTTVVGLNNAHSDVFALKRYMVDGRADWNGFLARVNGFLGYPADVASRGFGWWRRHG